MITILLSLILILAPILRGSVNACVFTSIYLIILSILLICIARIFVNKEIRLRKTPIDIAVLIFFLTAVISSFNFKYIYGSVAEISKFISLGLIFYITVNFITEESDIKKILNLLLVTGSCVAIFGIFQYFGIIPKDWWANRRFLSATYVNHNHFAGYLELLIPVSIGMALSTARKYKKALYVASFLVLSAAFLLSMSRGGWLALSISMFLMAAVIFKKGRIRFIVLMSALVFITLAVFAFNAVDISFLLKRVSSYKELDFSGRLEIWKGTLGIIKDNFMIGTGPGSFIYNFPKYRLAGLNMFVNYAHSDYLQVFSEMGIFGFGALIFIIWAIVKKALRTHMIAHSSFKVWASLGLSAGILSMALHNIGDFNFYIPANAIIFAVFSGFIFNISSLREGEAEYFILKQNLAPAGFLKVITLSVAGIAIILASLILAAECYSTVSGRAISGNDLKRGEALAYKATRLNPFNAAYHYKLAGIYNETARAIPEYEKSLSLNPLDSRSWIGLADAYYELFKAAPADNSLSKSAEVFYKNALDLDPLNSQYLKKFADFLLDMKNTGLSSLVYKKASHVISKTKMFSSRSDEFTDAMSYEDIARLAFSANDINKAMVFYKMAENFKGDNEEPKLGQVRCYVKMSLMKKALDKYLEIKPSKNAKSVLFAVLGEYCLGKDMIRSAENFSKRAIRLNPKNPEGFQLRYKIAKQARGLDNSMEEFKDVLDFNSVTVSANDVHEARLGIRGKLNKEGSLSQDVILASGIYEFNIEAKGDIAQGLGPHIKVKFNGMEAMNVYVNDTDWRYYPGIIVVDHPLNRFDIIYDNDYYNPETKEDRNLYIGSIKLKVLY